MEEADCNTENMSGRLTGDKPGGYSSRIHPAGVTIGTQSVKTHGTTQYEGQVRTKAGNKVSLGLDPEGKPIKK